MAAIFRRRLTWWIRFYHPASGVLVRESLGTHDQARAELLRQRLELEIRLLEPRFGLAVLPDNLRRLLGVPQQPPNTHPSDTTLAQQPFPATNPVQQTSKRVPIEEAVSAYIGFIRAENAPMHAKNKISILRKFLGSERLNALLPSKGTTPAQIQSEVPAFFTGTHLDEITPALIQRFIDGQPVGQKSKRHYRELFHHFMEYCLKFGMYQPTNWHCPNPVAALPSYLSRNRHIVYLNSDDIQKQLEVLAEYKEVKMAVAIMLYAGLRRAELLWLTRDALAKDLSYLSIVNQTDHEKEVESTLKTGQRAVTILPALRQHLEEYLSTLKGKWLIPNGSGKRYDGNVFGRKLHQINQAAGLRWNCLHYRHTYATQRAADGWPLFRIAKELGNSVAVVEEYYAGFISPHQYTNPQ